MCLIVFTPNARRATIRKATLAQGFDRNDDGAGFAYVSGGKLHVSKAYFDFNAFYADYQFVCNLNGPVLIHFRYGTKGSKAARNTQPLTIHANSLVMAHNGVIQGLSQSKEDVSDSVKLARLIQRLDWRLPFKPAQIDLLGSLCYDNSKLVFLDAQGRHLIVHEDEGVWRRGAWYSNKGVESCLCAYVKPRARRKKGSSIRVKPTRLLPPGTDYRFMSSAQKAMVEAWEEARKDDPSMPPPWSNPIDDQDYHAYPRYHRAGD